MQSDHHVHNPSSPDPVQVEPGGTHPANATGGTIKDRLSGLMHRVQHSIWPVSGGGAITHDVSPAAHAGNGAANGSDHGLITQINVLDHTHMQAFPAHRKAQVMEKIMSLTPIKNEEHQGNNQFEKAVMHLHREGYGLIDLQPQETVFTSVWYRKIRAFGGSADVTMLLWEVDENDMSITMMRWRI